MSQSIFSNKILQNTIFGICALYCIFLQFYRLGDFPIVQWDESRLAVNAAEMYESGNFLVNTYENKPDLYNTKPPLMIALQVVSAYIFGLNEFSIRFPSAVAGIVCIFLCSFMVYKKTENLYASCFAAILLSTSNGFIQLHGSMTGDFDALLTLFALATLYHHQNYLLHRSKKSYTYCILFLSLAILSKSAAGCILIPVIFCNSFIRGSKRKLFKTTVACILGLLPFVLYCIIRESASPGYWEAIKNNDFIGRFGYALEGHTSNWYYYIVNLFDYRFNIYIWLLIPALYFGFSGKSKTYFYYSLSFVLYTIFLSIAQTRIHWYDMPLLPLIAVLIGIFAHVFYHKTYCIPYRIPILLVLVLGLVYPIKTKTEFITNRNLLGLDRSHYTLSEMMRLYKAQEQVLYLAPTYDAEFYFYSIKNPNILRGQFRKLKINDIVMHGNAYKDSLDAYYSYTVLETLENARKIHIDSITIK